MPGRMGAELGSAGGVAPGQAEAANKSGDVRQNVHATISRVDRSKLRAQVYDICYARYYELRASSEGVECREVSGVKQK